MSTNYGKQIKWSVLATNPVGGFSTDFDYTENNSEDDHEDGQGNLGATILHDLVGDFSFSSKLTHDAWVPVLGTDGACKIAIDSITGGACLLNQVVETGGLKLPRVVQFQGQHFPDLTAGGASDEVDEGVIDGVTSPPICIPAGRLGWGTGHMASALGIIQRYSITQTIRLSPYSEGGKIVAVIASLFQMRFQLQVLALAAATRPATRMPLVLSTAPERFQANNVITSAQETHRENDGVMYTINSRWAPAYDTEIEEP